MSARGAPGVRIGLEIHVYVNTRSKLFCTCSARFLDAAPNTQICPICTGQPGTKPMAPNGEAIRLGLQVAQALGCRFEDGVRFQRKHYFYPDLPSNYQRTSTPFAVDGSLEGVRIRDIHWEEDPGAYDLKAGTVDYNRAGAPLLEIVTEPDLTGPAHARAFLAEVRLILDYLDANYVAAGLKADVNVSVGGGPRAEVKNVNGTRNVEAAIEHEVERQTTAFHRGERLERETRHFDETTLRTTRLRAKEEEADYRYMDDPDLPRLPLPEPWVRAFLLPEAPLALRERLASLAGVPQAQASVLLRERAFADAFEAVAREVPPPVAFEYFQRDLRGELNARAATFASTGLTPNEVAALLAAREARAITPQVGTRILRARLDTGASIRDAVAAEAGVKGEAEAALEEAARAAVGENPKAVADYRAGKATAVNFLVGAVMKRVKGRADPAAVRAAVERALSRVE